MRFILLSQLGLLLLLPFPLAANAEPQDAISTVRAQRLLLELVNAERARQGVGRLSPSRPASQLAREHALEMARQGYIGHYDLAGRKPELRYNLLGETDHVAENIAFLEIGGRVQLSVELVRSMFADLLASPRHRANILHPAHTHLGSAVVVRRSATWTQVYIVQEFVNDWGDFELLTATVSPGQTVALRGRLVNGATLAYVGLATEPLPGPRVAAQIGEADLHYRQPAPAFYVEPGKGIEVAADGSFVATLGIPAQQGPLDVYVTVWAVALGLPKPFRVMTQVLLLEEGEQ